MGKKVPKMDIISNKLATSHGAFIAKRMSKHSFSVIFIDLIFFTEHGKGMPTVVGRVFFDSYIFKSVIYLSTEVRGAS